MFWKLIRILIVAIFWILPLSSVLLFADDPTNASFYTERHFVGNVLWKADYKPFGEEQSVIGTIENNKRFAGKEKDEETGLYYFGARYMRPEIGRFITVDPVGPVDARTSKTNEKMLVDPQRLNRYTYGLNNPYRYMDPDGRDAIYVEYVDYKITLPIKLNGHHIKLPLGHAAVIAVDPVTGLTKYFEYGRYDKEGFGKVRRRYIPNLVIKDGKPTEESLQNLYKYISEHYGQGKEVEATYYSDADFKKVVDFAIQRMNNKNRDKYNILTNNCKTFAEEAIDAGRKKWKE